MIKETSLVAVISLISAVLTLFSNVFISRFFGVEAFGEFSYYFSLLSLLSVAGCFGINQFLLMKLPVLNRDDQLDLVSKSSCSLFPFVLLIAFFIYYFSDPELSVLSRFLLSVTFIFIVISLQRQSYYFANGKVILFQLLDKFLRLILFVLFLAFFCVNKSLAEVDSIFLSLFLSYFIISLLYIIKRGFVGVIITKISFLSFVNIKESFSLLGVVIATILMSNIDILYLGYFKSSEEVALFSAPQKLALASQLFLMAITNVLTPRLVKKNASGESVRYENKISARFGSLIILFFFITMYFYGTNFLVLFGSGFESSFNILMILVGSSLLSSLFGQTLTMMKVKGEAILATVYVGIALLLKVVMLESFYQYLNITGVAITTIITIFVWNFLCMLTLMFKHKVNTTVI